MQKTVSYYNNSLNALRVCGLSKNSLPCLNALFSCENNGSLFSHSVLCGDTLLAFNVKMFSIFGRFRCAYQHDFCRSYQIDMVPPVTVSMVYRYCASGVLFPNMRSVLSANSLPTA